MNAVETGRVVIPKLGRDKGRPMVVLKVEDEFAYIADGRLRTVEKPKKKKLKHLYPQKELLDNIRESINNGQCVLDAEIRRALGDVGETQGGVKAWQKTM